MNISESLVEIQNLLGESYFKIGDSLKNLKSEVDCTLAESETVIKEFRNNLENKSAGSLSSVVFHLEDKVASAQKSHKEYTEQFLSVMSRIFNSFDVLNNMHQPIERIITSAEQMELLALNAMVVAIQAGNKGGGFTCITDGFQKNARTALHLAGALNDQRALVSDQFSKLKEESEKVLEQQKKISAVIKGSMKSDFITLRSHINSSVDFIEDVYNEAQQMKPAVYAVFEGLQNQDIIRQSMDHMLLSLEELDKINFEKNQDEGIYLSKKLYDLCLYVLEEVTGQLGTDKKILKENTDKMISLLSELEERKEKFSTQQFGTDEGDGNLVKTLYGISSTFEHIVDDSESVCAVQSEIVKYKNRLLNSLARLHEFITAFNDPVSLFNNTIILARIEIARQPVIRNVETSINDISDEVGIISDAAKEIENIYENFNMLNRTIDSELKKIINENNDFTLKFKNDIRKLTELSDQSGKIFRELLNELNFLNSSFKTIFSDIRANIDSIDTSRNSLKNMKEDIKKELEGINKSFSMIDDKKMTDLMESREIDNLLNKFTIFRHKEKILNNEASAQTAADSSITLF